MLGCRSAPIEVIVISVQQQIFVQQQITALQTIVPAPQPAGISLTINGQVVA